MSLGVNGHKSVEFGKEDYIFSQAVLNLLLRRHFEFSDWSLINVSKVQHQIVYRLEDKMFDICNFFLEPEEQVLWDLR